MNCTLFRRILGVCHVSGNYDHLLENAYSHCLLIEMAENQNKYDYVNILMKVPSRPSLTYA